MAYGAEFTNSKGQVIIDGESETVALWDSGSLVAYGVTGFAQFRPITVSPFIALNPKTWFIGGNLLFGKAPPYTAGPPYDIFWTNAGSYYEPGGVDVDWIIGAPASHVYANLVSTDYGLNVFDAAGSIVFSSSIRQIRVIDVVPFTAPANGATTTISHVASSKPYYVMQNTFGMRQDSTGSYVMRFKNNNSTSLSVQMTRLAPGGTIHNRIYHNYLLIVCEPGD